MTRTTTFTALLLALAACGSNGDNGGNAAVGKTFTYGAPAPLPAGDATTLNGELQGALGLYAASDPSVSEQLSDTSGVTSALFGSSTGMGFLVAPTSPERAALLADGGSAIGRLTSFEGYSFDNPGCATTSGGKLTMSRCSVTITDQTTKMTITADGTATLVPGSLTWDFTVGLTMTDSTFSATAQAHRSGTLRATSSTLVGEALTEVSATASGGGFSQSVAVSESVSLDLAFAAGCVNSGTLEAKRVWSKPPSDTSGGDYSDRGALVKWTGCGVATIALSR
jgi:hypothetical protein